MCGFWDSQMTTPDLKSTHRSCGWSLVKSLGHPFLKTPYQCFMWYLTEFVLNTEDENWTQNTHIYDHFCRSYPRERKSYPWILFLIKIQLEMNDFLRSDLSSSSSSTITEKIGVPVIMIHLLRLNQNRISVHFWRKKWRFWSRSLPILSVDPSMTELTLLVGDDKIDRSWDEVCFP